MIYEICAGDTYGPQANWILINRSGLDLEKLHEEFKSLDIPINDRKDFGYTHTFVEWLKEKYKFEQPEISFIILEN